MGESEGFNDNTHASVVRLVTSCRRTASTLMVLVCTSTSQIAARKKTQPCECIESVACVRNTRERDEKKYSLVLGCVCFCEERVYVSVFASKLLRENASTRAEYHSLALRLSRAPFLRSFYAS